MQHTSNRYCGGGADRGAGFRSHQLRAGSPEHLLRFTIAAGNVIGLPETVLGKVEPTGIAPLLRQTDDLLAGGNRLDRRAVEVLRRRSDRHGGDLAPDIVDRAGAPFGFLAEIQPFGDPAGSHERHARLDPQVDGFGLARRGKSESGRAHPWRSRSGRSHRQTPTARRTFAPRFCRRRAPWPSPLHASRGSRACRPHRASVRRSPARKGYVRAPFRGPAPPSSRR